MIILLSAFFFFELLWGNTLSVGFIIGGYSTFSFIGIYLLAGMLHKLSLRYNAKCCMVFFLSVTLINAFCYIMAVYAGSIAIRDMVFNYINPIVIVASASLLLFFAKSRPSLHKTTKNIILWLASSCFAAYLLHVGTGYAFANYKEEALLIYNSSSGFKVLFLLVLYTIAVFLLAVIIDQPRKLIWRKALLPLFKSNA